MHASQKRHVIPPVAAVATSFPGQWSDSGPPGPHDGKDEKFRMTNLEWGVDFFSMTNLVKTSSVGQI